MTDSMEFYASSIDEAVEKAALELGVSSAEVSYRVVDEGNSGFLGIGARDARIVVEAPAPHASDEQDPPYTSSAETEVVEKRESRSRPEAGIVFFEHRATNQRGEIVARCRRTALMKKKL
jgi:predicted RNA-binding protein Jag